VILHKEADKPPYHTCTAKKRYPFEGFDKPLKRSLSIRFKILPTGCSCLNDFVNVLMLWAIRLIFFLN